MKRTISVLLVLVMLALTLTACDSPFKPEPSPTPKPVIADDNALPGATFTAPAGFVKVNRTIDVQADGRVIEKDLTFYYDEDGKEYISFAYGYSDTVKIEDELDIDEMEKIEQGGLTFYARTRNGALEAFAQKDNDIYGVQYYRDGDAREKFDEAIKTVTFGEVDYIKANEEGLGVISYKLDEKANVASTSSSQTEKIDGTLIEKSMAWRVGKDNDNLDYRFLIRYDKDAKLEDILDDSTEYEDGKLGELDAKIRMSDEKPISYFVQYGVDVYEIKNLGVSSGWFVNRSDESHEAFAAFIKSITFTEPPVEEKAPER